jgi:hypothetical protein
MFSPSKRLAIVLAVAIACTLLVPLLVTAGTVEADPAPPPERTVATGLYQVRCWQYGRLLFEERDVQLPSDVAAGVKLRGSDRNKLPVYVADTGNATCLIRGGTARR